MAVFLALLAIGITLVMVYLKYMHGYWTRRGIPHEEPTFPMGNLKGWRSTKHITQIMEPIYQKFKGTGPIAGFYFMFKPAAFILDLETTKNILIKDFNNFDDRGVFHNEKDDPISAHLFAMDGDKWRPLRHKLSPTFTSGKMKTMYPTVLKIGEEFLNVFDKKVDDTKGSPLEVIDLVGRFTADVIGTCAFGLECNSLHQPDAEFVRIGRDVLIKRRHNVIIDSFMESFPKLAARLRMIRTPQHCTDFYQRIVRDMVSFREKNNVKRNDYMDMLIAMKNGPSDKNIGNLTVDEIAAQAFVFFIAGFETSSTTMGFALYELAQNKEIQERMRNEIEEVFKRHNNEFTYECMKDMRYVDRVISETLRRYPIVPQLQRYSKSHYNIPSHPNYYIEKGMTAVIPVYQLHHDPDIWPEPLKFNPDRFTDEEVKKRPSCAWLPFGDGPRNCIGLRFGVMQVTIGLTYLIRNFKFSVCDRTKIPMEFNKESVLLGAKGGIHLKVEKVY